LQRLELGVFVFHQEVDTVQRNATVVTDDTTTAIGIRQTGQNARFTAVQDVFGVNIEYALVVSFAVFGEDFFSIGSSSRLYALQEPSTILIPPNGMIARFSGASVCRPTIFSRPFSM
jgi:hypothetical protein